MKFLNIVGKMNHFLNPEQIFQNYAHLQKTRTQLETKSSFKIHKHFLKTSTFFNKNMNIIEICAHFFRMGTCVENSELF